MAKHVCIFCGSAPINREHVIPDWAFDAIIQDPRGVAQDIDSHRRFLDGELLDSWSFNRRHVDFVARCVCVRCNEGWMSGLEGNVRPLVAEMIRDGLVQLSVSVQEVLAQWLCLKAIVGRYVMKPPRPVDERVAHDFFRTRVPPNTWQMWLARYRGDQPVSLSSQPGQVDLLNIHTGARLSVKGHIFSLSIGYFAAQIFEATQLVPIAADPAALIQIWPHSLGPPDRPAILPADVFNPSPHWPPQQWIDNVGLQALRDGPAGMAGMAKP